jgi:hypothetical protein
VIPARYQSATYQSAIAATLPSTAALTSTRE